METPKAINLLQNKRIAIVGGGPGGLTLARLLQMKGAEVKVYERDYSKEARVQGAIVDLHFDSGQKVIEKAGLMDAFKANYMQGADKYCIVDKHGAIHYEDSGAATGAGFGDKHFRPEIDRGTLRNVLLNALHPDTVIWDSRFISMALVNDEWKLEFKNGTTATADMVIGSDGARSKIRPYITDIQPQYTGATIIQGEIENPEKDCPEIYKLANSVTMSAFGDRKVISVQPRGDRGFTFYAAAKYTEDWVKNPGIDFNNNDEVCAYLIQFYEGWDPVFFTLFKASLSFVLRPLNCVPLDQRWAAQPNITIIGDAAHIMPPSGEGVNTAMLDALDLSECLTDNSFKDLQTAIAAYEEKMLTRAAELAQESLEGTEGMYNENALEETVQFFNDLSRK